VKHHDWSRRARGHFQLSNVVRGQKVKKLLSDHEARQKSWRICAPLVVKLLTSTSTILTMEMLIAIGKCMPKREPKSIMAL
jgi:hypothetical protein